MANHSEERQCMSCAGSGEAGSEVGVIDCPDCGGIGRLPPAGTLVEWRARDIEKNIGESYGENAADVRWLTTELRQCRRALTEILSLAEEASDELWGKRILITAARSLHFTQEVTTTDESND